MSNALALAAQRFDMQPQEFEKTLRATVIPKECTNEQFMAFLLVANEYQLNPLLKEIYAFPAQSGGIQPIVPIDGWIKIINRNEAYDGMEFQDKFDDAGKLFSITCTIYRKDRSRPTVVTEYLAECMRNTNTWRQWPARMLRHKSIMQCARLAFGYSGIVDPDEYERGIEKAVSGEHSHVDDGRGDIVKALETAAQGGMLTYSEAFQALSAQQRMLVGVDEHNRLKTVALARQSAIDAGTPE